jgi:hypothetical protein
MARIASEALIEADPARAGDEPPMPGKVEYEQAKKFAKAFIKGQPHKGDDRDHAVPGQDRAASGVRKACGPGASGFLSPAPGPALGGPP